MSIVFDNVSFCYPNTEIGVFDINLEIAKGELLSIIGPSGSGKSTLLKLLSGFLLPDSGRIFLDGKDITNLRPETREIGQVFQSYALFPHMSVAENVAYPLKVRGIEKGVRLEKARQALERVGLPVQGDRYPNTLSGGQQQRVALARALVFSPKALLLDEPLSALDASLRGAMRDEILSVQQGANIASLFVTHDQEEALSMGTRVGVMFEGQLIQVDTPTTLYDQPANAKVAGFVGRANFIEATVISKNTLKTAFGVFSTHTTDPYFEGNEVIAMIRPERLMPHSEAERTNYVQNCISGDLQKDRFLGSVRQYDIAGPNGLLLQGETTYRGSIRAVSIPADAIRLLPKTKTNMPTGA